MSADAKLNVVLCWHMHQPQYRDLIQGEYRLPWTYLHAIKDYVDMAAHLEAVPQARAVVNFAPILLEQIDDYAQQLRGHVEQGRAIHDPLLNALADPVLPSDNHARASLMHACLRANRERMIQRFPAFAKLAELAVVFKQHPQALGYVRNQYLVDLLVWYHLAWMGETVRREDPRIKQLMQKEKDYSVHDRRELLLVILELLEGVLPRYRKLAESGQVELAVSPYAHPIIPLLLDIHSASEAMPNAPLPALQAYPDGRKRAHWHMQQAIECFEHHFGFRPQGCWPSEGAISDDTLRLCNAFGMRWVASGESVLHHSQSKNEQHQAKRDHALYQAYRIDDCDTACFFRDDKLSDQIGFVFSDWHADDAVANLVHHLENIANTQDNPGQRVVSIILDGENAWEYYPENAYYFLSALYQVLASHERLNLTTFSNCLDAAVAQQTLTHIVPGSWVHGNFSTWIGETDKNRGWDMLGEAKTAYDNAIGELNDERRQLAQQQLAVCEGSDWFWWFGGDNPAASVSDFDFLYRMHLSHLYQLLCREPPEYLAHAFTHGGGEALHGGTMRPGQAGQVKS